MSVNPGLGDRTRYCLDIGHSIRGNGREVLLTNQCLMSGDEVLIPRKFLSQEGSGLGIRFKFAGLVVEPKVPPVGMKRFARIMNEKTVAISG